MRSNDNAVWNRLRVIPFRHTIPSEEVDRDMPAKLMSEAEGILGWAVAGSVLWFREGLGSLPELDQQIRFWRMEADQVGRFLDDCCQRSPDARTAARELYLAYRDWVESGGEEPMTETAFGRSLSWRGFEKQHTERGRGYRGLRCRPPGRRRSDRAGNY